MQDRKKSELTTLCYIEKDGSYLMLHRVKKDKDVNKDKWIGVGGHFEKNESPEECLLREVKEETGLTLTSWIWTVKPGRYELISCLKGIIYFLERRL